MAKTTAYLLTLLLLTAQGMAANETPKEAKWESWQYALLGIGATILIISQRRNRL